MNSTLNSSNINRLAFGWVLSFENLFFSTYRVPMTETLDFYRSSADVWFSHLIMKNQMIKHKMMRTWWLKDFTTPTWKIYSRKFSEILFTCSGRLHEPLQNIIIIIIKFKYTSRQHEDGISWNINNECSNEKTQHTAHKLLKVYPSIKDMIESCWCEMRILHGTQKTAQHRRSK